VTDLIECITGHDIEGGSDETDGNGVNLGAMLDAFHERGLDCVDALVGKARDLKV